MSEAGFEKIHTGNGLRPISGLFSLTEKGLFQHELDPITEDQYLVPESGLVYPFDVGGVELERLLLRRVNLVQDDTTTVALELPKHFVTMGQALNDTIGNVPTSISLELTKKLFEKIGNELSILASIDHVLPEILTYKQILVVKDEEGLGIKLIPPLTLQHLHDESVHLQIDTTMMLGNQLLISCYYGASNKSQQDALPDVFKSFTRAFRWHEE